MPGGREAAHVHAGLGDDHVGDEHTDPGDRDDQVPGAAPRSTPGSSNAAAAWPTRQARPGPAGRRSARPASTGPTPPLMSLATEDSLIPASSSSFSSRWISRARVRTHRGPRPGQVPQLPDRLRWHERAPDQPMRPELGQPRGVGNVGLAPRQVLHVPGIDQQHLERAVLQQVVERLPVVPGRLITTSVTCSAIRCSRNAST